ncbi:MAG: restriction endonuclease subunit S [Fusobacteriaceae bacterium]|nr:restriction endonuclease subunit S [Fusobacteriaceae bacterium]
MENREIPDGWRETTLGEVAEIVMGQSPKGESYNTDGDGIPFYQGVTEFNDKYVAIKTFTNQPTKIVEPNTILFSVRAPVGRVNFTKHKSCIGRGNAGFTIKNGSQEFLYYLLINIENYIKSHSSGTVFSSISGKELKEIKVTVPSIYEEQVAIGQVLSSLDEKIELLEEENKTLETLAQTIFTEWFVNFNFPEATGEMEDSELGEIPKGWRVGKLGEIAEIKNGFAFKSEDYVPQGMPIVRTTNFDNGTIVMDSPVYLSIEKSKEYPNYFLEELDFLLVMVGASIGKNVLVPSYILPALQNQNMWNFKSLNKEYKLYNIFLFKQLIMRHSNSASGSAREFFRKDFFYNLDILLPNDCILISFKESVENLFKKIDMNITQIQTLKTTRDTLLPKLTTGEIRVEGFGE